MDYFFERKVKFNIAPEYKSNENWCLNEYDESDTQVGGDWIPFKLSLSFSLTQLKILTDLRATCEQDLHTQIISSNLLTQDRTHIIKTIFGKCNLNDISSPGNKNQLSIFGTARTLKEFGVSITAVKADASAEYEDSCWFTVIPSYESEGYDFNKKIEKDFAGFEVFLNAKKFDELAKLIQSKSVDSASLSMSNVEGAYSRYLPTISRHYEIKLLTDGNAIEGVEKSKFEGTTVSKVGSFNIEFTSVAPLSGVHNLPSIDLSGEFKEDVDVETLNLSRTNVNLNQSNVNPIAEVIKDLKIPLWCIFIVLILLLIK